MQKGWSNKGCRRCYPHGSPLPVVGAVLVGTGLILLFVCIPGWAWAALAGLLLIAVGYGFIRLGKGR